MLAGILANQRRHGSELGSKPHGWYEMLALIRAGGCKEDEDEIIEDACEEILETFINEIPAKQYKGILAGAPVYLFGGMDTIPETVNTQDLKRNVKVLRQMVDKIKKKRRRRDEEALINILLH